MHSNCMQPQEWLMPVLHTNKDRFRLAEGCDGKSNRGLCQAQADLCSRKSTLQRNCLIRISSVKWCVHQHLRVATADGQLENIGLVKGGSSK